MPEWQTVLVPHRPRRSFDFATCVCGWMATDDDEGLLQWLVDQHNLAQQGLLVEVESREWEWVE